MGSPNMDAIIEAAPQNPLLQNTLLKMDLKLTHYRNPVCSVSGGSDSDIMIDIIERVRGDRPVTYVFFDTGIEMAATKRHLDELREKYGIEIIKRGAVIPVAKGCREHGLPFLSKAVAENIDRLQQHGFRWEDAPYWRLALRYPGCTAALKWWCNEWGDDSRFNIDRFPYLKDFMLANPPKFRISKRCCQGSKKDTAHLCDTEFSAHLKIIGERRAEGGQRATAHSSCFTAATDDQIATYRPLFFWSDADKAEYAEYYGVTYSDAYTVYGLPRTGCAGCPFGSNFETELAVLHEHEPKLANAVESIFGASYEYMRAYRAYRDRCKARDKTEVRGQIGFDDAV